jgi:DNA-binding transcriptional regulator PaaX
MSRPNTGPYLSDQMRRVLGACVASSDGVAAVTDLVAARTQYGQGQAVARASLSRILRRLWCLGLVELSDAADRPAVTDWTFARVREQAQRYREMADSDAKYREVRRFRKESGMEVPTRAEYREEYHYRGSRPEVRARWVAITDKGRRARPVNSAAGAGVNS